MKLIRKTYIAKEFAIAIVNEDLSGLSDEDDEKLFLWYETVDLITIDSIDEQFTRCEISSLMGDCYLISIWGI